MLELLGDAVENDGELWAAMIDHRAGHRLENHGRDGCGSRDAQVDFFFLRGLNHLAVLAGTTRGANTWPRCCASPLLLLRARGQLLLSA